MTDRTPPPCSGSSSALLRWPPVDYRRHRTCTGPSQSPWNRSKTARKGRRNLRKILQQRLPFPDGSGFPDLVDFEKHFMLEIKTRAERAVGMSQLRGYLLIAKAIDPTWRAGTSFDYIPFRWVPCNSTLTCIAFVDPPDSDGVITYNVWDLKPNLMTYTAIACSALSR